MMKRFLSILCICLMLVFQWETTAHSFSLLAAAPLVGSGAGMIGAAAIVTIGSVAIYASNDAVRASANGLAKKVYYQSIQNAQTLWGVGYALLSMPSLIAKGQQSPGLFPHTAALVSANQTLMPVGGTITSGPTQSGITFDGMTIVADAATANAAAIAQKNVYIGTSGYVGAGANSYGQVALLTAAQLISWGFPSNVVANQWGSYYAVANIGSTSHYKYYTYPVTAGTTVATTNTSGFASAVVTNAATDSVLAAELESSVTSGMVASAGATSVPLATTYPLTASGPAVYTDNPADSTAAITTYPPYTALNNAATQTTTGVTPTDITSAITSALGLTSAPPDTAANTYDTGVTVPTPSPISTLFDFIIANSPLLSLGSRIHITTSNTTCKISSTLNLVASGNTHLHGSGTKLIELDFCPYTDVFTWIGSMFVALAHAYAAFILLGRRENN